MKEQEISRQEFDDLKADVRDLKQVFDRINSIAISNNDNTQSQTYPINIGNIVRKGGI